MSCVSKVKTGAVNIECNSSSTIGTETTKKPWNSRDQTKKKASSTSLIPDLCVINLNFTRKINPPTRLLIIPNPDQKTHHLKESMLPSPAPQFKCRPEKLPNSKEK